MNTDASLRAVMSELAKPTKTSPADYASALVRADPEAALERKSQVLSEAIRHTHEQAALAIETACDALIAETESCVVLAREAAQSLRSMGESHAITMSNQAEMIVSVAKGFREQTTRLAKFKMIEEKA